jgi:hypothetical protein
MPPRLLTLTLAVCFTIAGCCHCPNGPSAGAEYRLNPPNLLSMAQVVNVIDSNNEKIPTLWATLNYSATINDKGQVHSVSSDDGVLLYRHPTDFRLVGKKEFVGNVFDIGSNDREYWLEVIPGTSRLWWGTYADLARVTSSELPIPIRPDLVMEVLGVGTINTDFNAQPVPTMRYDNAADAYVFIFNFKAPDRWLAEREIWYDRATLRPRRVILYDANGRPVLKANLSLDKRVQIPGDPNTQNWPLVPGDYKLFFPDSGSRMEFSLKDVRLNKGKVPNPASFRLPDVSGTDVRAIQIGGGGAQ